MKEHNPMGQNNIDIDSNGSRSHTRHPRLREFLRLLPNQVGVVSGIFMTPGDNSTRRISIYVPQPPDQGEISHKTVFLAATARYVENQDLREGQVVVWGKLNDVKEATTRDLKRVGTDKNSILEHYKKWLKKKEALRKS